VAVAVAVEGTRRRRGRVVAVEVGGEASSSGGAVPWRVGI